MDPSFPQPGKEPLGLFLRGTVDPLDPDHHPRLEKRVPAPGHKQLMSQLLRLAESIILHPHNLPIVTDILANTMTIPAPEIKTRIHHIFAYTTFDIYLDKTLVQRRFGRHYRPISRLSSTVRAIYVNTWHYDQLVEAYLNRQKQPATYYQHATFVALGLAHELIYVLQTHLSPDQPRPKFLVWERATSWGVAARDEAATSFEQQMLNGELAGVWTREAISISVPEIHPSVRAELAEMGDGEDVPQAVVTYKDGPFEMLLIERGGVYFQIEKSWLERFIDSFESGTSIESITFPPEVNPEPVKVAGFDQLRLRDPDEGHCVVRRRQE